MSKRAICSIAVVASLITGGMALESVEPIGVSPVIGQAMQISPRGLALIGDWESCRLHPYQCPAGKLTNGVGNTRGVSGEPITVERAAKDWARNVLDAEQCVQAATAYPMTQGQYDAFTSFAFNVGCHRFRHKARGGESTIHRLIRAGKMEQACYQLPRFVYANGKKLRGLENRRADEFAVCMGG